MMIVMEGAQALVMLVRAQAQSLGDPLNGEVAELLQFVSFNFSYLLF